MNRRQFLARFALLIFGISVSLAASHITFADDPKPNTPIELLVLSGEAPARLEIQIEVDGAPITDHWAATFAQLHRYFDRNSDGALNEAEAARLPTPFALRQTAWGQFAPQIGAVIRFEDLDADKSGAVSPTELASYYRKKGLGSAIVGVGAGTNTELLTKAILSRIDANHDGKTSQDEWRRAGQLLAQLDSNSDELLGPGELVSEIVYPGTNGSTLLEAARSAAALPNLPLLLLPTASEDQSWGALLNQSREKSKMPPVATSDLPRIRTSPPFQSFRIRLDPKDPASSAVVGTVASESCKFRFDLRTEIGKLTYQTASAAKRLTDAFQESDANRDGALDAQELNSAPAAILKNVLGPADRDANDELSTQELTAWLDLQKQIAKGQVVLTVLDLGPGLFELLDANHDASLSLRELRTAWKRIESERCVAADALDCSRLPNQFFAITSHGRPTTLIGKPRQAGPEWFLAMDRNGDGEVSKTEFVGAADIFAKLDQDHDGLLTADEAATVGNK